jgi:AraC-like DNA-binding protein
MRCSLGMLHIVMATSPGCLSKDTSQQVRKLTWYAVAGTCHHAVSIFKTKFPKKMNDFIRNYTIGQFTNQGSVASDFAITRFDNMDEPDVDAIHKHTFYEILWVDEGSSRQSIDFRSYKLHPKSLFFISPGQVHEFEEWDDLRGGTIMFTEDFFLHNQQNKNKLFELTFLDNVYFNPLLLLDCQDYASFRHYIDLLITEKHSAGSMKEILQALLHILLLQVQRSIKPVDHQTTSKRNIQLFKQFKNILESNFTQSLSTSDYATKLNITSHHLNRIVKEITGETAGAVIKSRSMLEAKRLLSFTDLSVSQISSQLSYYDSSYFSKLFKSSTGRTPVEFKMEMSRKYRKVPVSL